MTIGFERTTYLVSEGNVVDVCVVLTGTLRRTLDVFVNSSSGSATGTTNKVLWYSPKGYFQGSNVTYKIRTEYT